MSATRRFRRLLLTGAAGGLGRVLRLRLKNYCDCLRVSDIVDLGTAAAGEELQVAPLENKMAVRTLLDGVDAVVHLGGISTEQPFESVMPANILGVFHLYEAARIQGVRRIVFASSNHATGFYRQDETIDPSVPMRPDSYYGLSKAFGENLAQFYFDRHGVETVSLRIGSSYPEPRDRRMLATWLSYDDLERLVLAALTAADVGHTVVYGMSDNRPVWWKNPGAQRIGYEARDSSEMFRAAVEQRQPKLDPAELAAKYQGGPFVAMGPF
ncbi:MAG: NAD(P)-dependent oxidoreductase [Betaproteobacteria bacterium]|nr:NAD(P)-dependent oxidoreductase [Betaproteobacteria bacterium]